jgi:hypothetical protein
VDWLNSVSGDEADCGNAFNAAAALGKELDIAPTARPAEVFKKLRRRMVINDTRLEIPGRSLPWRIVTS